MNELRPDWVEYYLNIATAVSKRATCQRKKVGAIIVNGNSITAGYNGAPAGQPHCIDVGCLMVHGHCKRSAHAEVNAIKNAKHDLSGGTLYSTLEPCVDCRRMLKQHGVTDYIWLESLADYYKSKDDIINIHTSFQEA